jgi:hypothetical protein
MSEITGWMGHVALKGQMENATLFRKTRKEETIRV